MEMEEMSKEEQMFAILCGTVQSLRSKKEYDIIESLYNDLLKCNLIHSIEDFKEGKLVKDSMEEALVYWIWRALAQKPAPIIERTLEDYHKIFGGVDEPKPF